MASDKKKQSNNKNSSEIPENKPNVWHLIAEGDWLAGQRFNIHGHAVLGRESNCDITIPGTHLSRRHAELAVKGQVMRIRDLGSSNGTYVNGKRVNEADLSPGDKVQFDVLTFRVYGPNQPETNDKNQTKVRLVPPTTKKPSKVTKNPTGERSWKNKPTSVGNRDKTVHMTTGQKAANSFWTALVALTGIVTLIAVGYLITQL